MLKFLVDNGFFGSFAGSAFLYSVGLLAVIAVLAIVIILLLANLGAYFTKIALGTTILISKADTLKAIWPNVGGYRMSQADDIDGRRWLIPDSDKESEIADIFHNSLPGTVWFQKWLWKAFGVKFISVVWPHTHVLKLDLREGGRRRIQARTELATNAPLRSRIKDSEEETIVDSLLFITPRPVYVEGVELAGDNSKINLLLLPVFRQVIPSLPAYYLKGDFYNLLDAAVEAGVVNFFANHRVAVHRKKDDRGNEEAGKEDERFVSDFYSPPQDSSEKKEYEERYEGTPLTYAHWLKLTKAGEGSPLWQQLRHLNVSRNYLKKLKETLTREQDTEKKGHKQKIIDYIEAELIPEEGASDIAISPSGIAAAKFGNQLSGMAEKGIVPQFGFALVEFKIVEWEAHEKTKLLAEALLARETQFHQAKGIREESYGVRDATKARAEGESNRFERLMQALVEKGVTPDMAAKVVETQLRTESIGRSTIKTYVEGGRSASVLVSDSDSPSTSSK